MKLNLIFLLCFCASLSFAQKDTARIYSYGGGLDEQGRDIKNTRDGGFIAIGGTSTFGNGNSDFYVVKTDGNLQTQWTKAIGEYNLDFGEAVVQSNDGGYFLAGHSNSSGNGSYDGYLVKIDSMGNKEWSGFYGGNDWDMFHDMVLTPDGGLLIAGETHSTGNGGADAWLVKTDSLGNVLWEKTMGGLYSDRAHAIIETSDGNYAFCGENGSETPEHNGDGWLVKMDDTAGVIFSEVYDRYQLNEVFYGLMEDSKGYFVCVGQIEHFESETQGINELILRYDFAGSRAADNHNLLGSHTDVFRAVVESNAGNYITAGYTNSFGAGGSGRSFAKRTIEMDTDLNLGYGPGIGVGEFDQFAYDMIKAPNGDRVVVGSVRSLSNTYSDLCITRFTQDTVASDYGESRELIFKEDPNLKPLSVNQIDEALQFTLFPNPADGHLDIQLNEAIQGIVTIRNLQGQSVYQETLTSTSTQQIITLDTKEIPAAFYLLEIQSESGQSMIKKFQIAR